MLGLFCLMLSMFIIVLIVRIIEIMRFDNTYTETGMKGSLQ